MGRPGPKLSPNPGKTAKYYRENPKARKKHQETNKRLTVRLQRKRTGEIFLRYVESVVLHQTWTYHTRTAELFKKIEKQTVEEAELKDVNL